MVEMQVDGLTLEPETNTPLLLLRTAEGDARLPLLIGPMEAVSLSLMLNGGQLPRPLTHDLLLMTVRALKGAVVGVEIVDLREGVFYAVLLLRCREGLIRVDCRPSDAVALALRTGVRIRVEERVLQKAREEGPRPVRADAAIDMLREAGARREAARLADKLARGKALGESGGDLAGYETLLRTLEPETSRKM